MIYPQREAEPESSPAGEARAPWRPPETPAARDGDPALTDAVLAETSYAAVDRIDGNVTTLAVAAWPAVDPATGRLDFGPTTARRVITVDLDRLQARVDGDRSATGQLVRPIRVSDVFLVIGLAGPIARWARVVDVTRAGRLAAKAALFSTVAPAPSADTAGDFGVDVGRAQLAAPGPTAAPAEEATPPPGPVAYPAV